MFRNILKQRKLQKCLKYSFDKHNNGLIINRNNNNKQMLPIISSNYCSGGQNESETHFGYQRVSFEEKSRRVNELFSNVAEKYDLMNDVMSLGIHRYWKQYLIEYLDPYPGTRLLDMAGGTGDITLEFIKHMKRKNDNKSSVVVCDINPEMLRVGQRKAQQIGFNNDSIEWVLGDAMNLSFDDNSFDAYTIAFGMRNIVHIDRALAEAYRVLRKGSIFLCLEFSQVTNPLFEKIYDLYSFEVIPVLGEVLAKDWNSYQYLVESIRQFPDQEDFKAMIESVGFTLVDYTNLMQGIAAIHVGYKK